MKWDERFDNWFLDQSFDVQFLIAILPLLIVGLTLTIAVIVMEIW